MNIAWAICGAGHYLQESFEVMEGLAKNHRVTTLLSGSGEEVVKAYGLWNRLGAISPGEYLEEVFTQGEQGHSSPVTGRFFLGKYDALVVSPATSNTVAKIACGISDTLVTNAVSHAMKGKVKVYVVPVDSEEKEVRITLPFYIDKILCARCSQCEPANSCERSAISDFRIDLLKCNACGICEGLCEYHAIIGTREVTMKVRKIDVENVKKIKEMDFVTVVDNPRKLSLG